MIANQAQYHFLLKVQRHLLGQHGYSKWSSSHALNNIWALTYPWEEAIHRAFSNDKDPEAVQRYINMIGNGPNYYRNLVTVPSKEFIGKEISIIRSKNQSRRTQDKAANLTEYRQMLSSTFEKKQYGRIIKLLTGDFPPQLDPHDLPGPNGEHLTDPIECLQAASAKFKRHYSRPAHHQGPLHNDNADWTEVIKSRTTFQAHIAHLMIPVHLSNLIWEAITDVPNIAEGRAQLHAVFTQPPTYDDYLTAIKSHKKDTAPGMSGLSYRHLKALPEDLHKSTYQMLCTLWPTQHIPDFWKQRWLVPLPKTAELSNIEDLRPICLLEIFRKLWTSILTHRIRGAWETHDMLDPSQHGFRAKHGTDSASLLLVDALEHAKETHSACLVSSWDIRRAFDSISKPALQMAWTRLGVPPEWASFLIQLDLDGNTTVRLPISQHAYDRTGLAGLHRLQALEATDILFPAARGVP